MTVPRASQFCCLSLKFVNQVWVWVHFILMVFAFLATISVGVFRVLEVNYDEYTKTRSQLLRIIANNGVEINGE